MGVEHLISKKESDCSCAKEFQLDSNHPMIEIINSYAKELDDCVIDLREEIIMPKPDEAKIKLLQTRMDTLIGIMDRYRFARFNVELLKNIRYPCLDCREVAKGPKQ